MLSDSISCITTATLDRYLAALAKEYRKSGGKAQPAELILVGGAAILARYRFRDSTTDIDAIVRAPSLMQDVIRRVGDVYGLPRNWLNGDFMRTPSYSPKLIQYSAYHKTYLGVLTVRIVTGEYLVAMKLRAGRFYKHDLSDIVGILWEHQAQGDPLSYERIDTAVCTLYGGWDNFPAVAKPYLQGLLQNGDYSAILRDIQESEQHTKQILVDYEADHPKAVTTDNLDSILQDLLAQQSQPSVLDKLK